MATELFEQLGDIFNPQRLRWQIMETAPKDGSEIEINYGTEDEPDVCFAFWSERPVCMLGNINGGHKPGWATCGQEIDRNLPLDEPNFWRPII
jgi:hypothetical protein